MQLMILCDNIQMMKRYSKQLFLGFPALIVYCKSEGIEVHFHVSYDDLFCTTKEGIIGAETSC